MMMDYSIYKLFILLRRSEFRKHVWNTKVIYVRGWEMSAPQWEWITTALVVREILGSRSHTFWWFGIDWLIKSIFLEGNHETQSACQYNRFNQISSSALRMTVFSCSRLWNKQGILVPNLVSLGSSITYIFLFQFW